MGKQPTTLDDLFNEVEAERAKEPLPPPMSQEELERRQDEFQRLLDEAGPEPDDEVESEFDEDDIDDEEV